MIVPRETVIHEKPKIYKRLKKQFGISWNDGVIITYLPYIYHRGQLTDEKMVHESIHLRQQSLVGVEKWWDKYCCDKNFRLNQEVEAYKAEVEFLRATISSQHERFKKIREICKMLSSSMYGNIISYENAMLIFV